MRHNFLVWLAIGACLSGLPARAQAASSWYVDNAVSGGSHDGTSWANAWGSFATVNWSGIHAGDTVYVSGGSSSKTYTEFWTVGAGGTSANPLTITVDASNPSHRGTVIFDYDGCGDGCTATGITLNQDYVTLTGNVNGANGIQLINLRNATTSRSTVGIYGTSNTGVIIDHVAFVNDNNPIRLDYANGVTVRNCSITGLRGDAGIALNASVGTFDANQIYGNYIEPVVNVGIGGADGIQGSDGISIHHNTIMEVTSSALTASQQHPDMMQITGNYIKVYANEFINVGDSVFDYDCWANSTPHDIWIYNNVFRILTTIDIYPEYFRMYSSSGGIDSITNVKFMNNTLIDNNYDFTSVIRFDNYRVATTTAAGNEFRNNLFYNAGGGGASNAHVIAIDDSPAFTSSSFAFDNNVYYQTTGGSSIRYRGVEVPITSWLAANPLGGGNESHSTTAQPLFASYVPHGADNDLRLQSGDTVALDHGASLASNFTTDKDGVTRPQGSAWDVGAYEYRPPGPAPNAPSNLTAVVH